MWRVRLFDGPELEWEGGESTSRFRSAKVGALLAYLALRLGRRCPREMLADALWPDEADAGVTANRLRVTLASLRRQLEPPGTPYGSVLDASVAGFVLLREESVWCDVDQFDRAFASGRVKEAAALLRGPLLPGLYEDWVRDEQLRFEAIREDLVREEVLKTPASPPLPFSKKSPLEPASPPDPLSKTSHLEPASPPDPLSRTSHLERGRGRLPPYLTRFVGRREEIEAVLRHLEESRLVTLTGPGGIGKTRLAVEAVAWSERTAVFVALEAEEGGIAEAILRAFGVNPREGDPANLLVEVLQGRTPTLLILDGAERRLEAIAETIPSLLAAVDGLGVLLTSRQRLELPGEIALAVSSLAFPASDSDSDSAQLSQSPAVELFLDRARTAVPDFVLRERHVGEVVAICRRLEGMPLALELAAARLGVQSLASIAAGLEQNAMELRSRQRGLSVRHRSLRAAIQGSVDALAPELQRLFTQLSVFRGGWTAEAAATVCDDLQAGVGLEELVVRSLVTAREDDAGEMRFAFLEPIRAFAQETLPPASVEALEIRHAARFLRLAAAASEDDLRTLRPLDAEGENLRRALERGRGLPEFWEGLAGALIHAFVRGHHRQALRWIDETLEELPAVAEPATRFRWRYAAAQILPDVGRLDETDALARAMRADAESTGDVRGSIYASVILAYVVELKGGIEAAIALCGEALRRARLEGDRHLMETCLSHQSGSLHVYGSVVGPESETGREALARAEALAREMRDLVPPHSRRRALAPLLVAGSLWVQGRLTEAVEFFKEAQRAAVALGTTTELMYAFVSEATIVAGLGSLAHSARLYGAFRNLQERMGYSLERAQSSRPPWIERLAIDLRAGLGEEAFERLVAEGRRASPAELVQGRLDSGD